MRTYIKNVNVGTQNIRSISVGSDISNRVEFDQAVLTRAADLGLLCLQRR